MKLINKIKYLYSNNKEKNLYKIKKKFMIKEFLFKLLIRGSSKI